MSRRPTLHERMIVKYRRDNNSQYYLLVEEVPLFGGACEGHNLDYNPDRGVLIGETALVLASNITGIYGRRRADGRIATMPREALERLVIYDNPYASDVLWESEEVKEMTMDEISKALGYTVKVVGNDHR